MLRPHGIVLVTGPTGSGKTTTLYSALTEINTLDSKILTVEDPVEYQLHGINQVQVKPQIGLDLRERPALVPAPRPRHHDDRRNPRFRDRPDRGPGRADRPSYSFDAAYQRRASAVTRLLDMGLQDYLLTSTMNGVARNGWSPAVPALP